MSNPTEKQIINTLQKTLDAYEKLIANPEKEKGKWEGYGNTTSCRLCKIFNVTGYCGVACPLRFIKGFSHCPCSSIALDRLLFALKNMCPPGISKAARARRKEIIESMDKAGYEYK